MKPEDIQNKAMLHLHEMLSEKEDEIAELKEERDVFANAYAGVLSMNAELKEAQAELVRAIKDVLWIDECRCDKCWTSRDMHEPNTYCGELDPLRDALASLKLGEDKE